MDITTIGLLVVAMVVVFAVVYWLARQPGDEDEAEVAGALPANERTVAVMSEVRGAEMAPVLAAAAASRVRTPSRAEVAIMQDTSTNEATPEAATPSRVPAATPTSGTGGAPEPTLVGHGSTATATAPRPQPAYSSAQPASTTWTSYDYNAPEEKGDQGLRILGVSASSVAVVGAAVGGAWYYNHWRQERNKPINRIRRQVRSLAKSVSGYVPDRDELMERLPDKELAAPLGGAGTGLLLGALVLANALRSRGADSTPSLPTPDVTVDRDTLSEVAAAVASTLDRSIRDGAAALSGVHLKDVQALGSELLASAKDRVQAVDLSDLAELPEKKSSAGLGLGGVAGVAALGYLAWRLLTRRESDLYQGWHPEAARGDTISNP